MSSPIKADRPRAMSTPAMRPKLAMSLPSGLNRSETFIRTFVRYTKELENYIIRRRARPPDIQYWPYGPYWPHVRSGEEERVIIETPNHIRTLPRLLEPLWNSIQDGEYMQY